jgi:epoxyqueuosine reductase
VELRLYIEQVIRAFLADPECNNLGPGTTGPAWEGFTLGFSSGADELYGPLKEHIGDFHWSPAEAFALGRPAGAADTGAAVRPEDLTVISWALCQTETTKAANRAQTRFPSEPWAVAPALLPECGERESPAFGYASTWSERHVAYISGLGTFGLCGGLITERGQAVRLGSLIVQTRIQPTPRPYSGPFAYCLFHYDGSCATCAERCPVGSVSPEGRDKIACARNLEPVTADYVKREYGFDGYGCGLCQTGVPCESGIPEPLAGQRR